MAFCPKCGDEAVDVFCEACLREREALVKEIRPFTLTKCVMCDRIKVQGKWVDMKEFPRLVERAVQFQKGAIIADVDFPRPVIEGRPKEFELPIVVRGTVSERVAPYEEEYLVTIPIELEQCERCGLAKSNYFEGTLQVRNPSEAIIEYIEKRVGNQEEVFITSAKDVRGGVDFQVSDQGWLHAFAHELHKRFGGEIKIQSRLHTYNSQTSKKVFRLTALIRLPKFGRGDVIEDDKRLLRITSMGATVKGWELRRRKNTSLPCPTDNQVVIHDRIDVVLSSVQPRPMILDPDTYQEIPISHPVKATTGITVSAVQDNRGKWYIADRLDSERDEE